MSDERDAFGQERSRSADPTGAPGPDAPAPPRRGVPRWVLYMIAADVLIVVIVAVVLLA